MSARIYHFRIMSKGIAILALLLTVAQSPAPVSREAANSTAHASTSVTSRSQKTPPTQSPPPANANQPPAPKGDAERQSQKNAQNSIEVTKFPSVSVNRDWVDWGVWIFSGLLVVVGFLQVLLLYGTLSTVKEQSGVLKQTLIHTHRPTIAVRNFYFSKVRGVGGLYGIKNGIEEGSFATGQFYIVNTGGTRATIREIVCQTYIGEERLPMNRPYEGNEGVKPDKLLMAGQSDVWIFGRQTPLGTDEAQALYFTAKATFFYVLGWIGYIDDLGIYRMTHFCRRFEPSKGRFVAVENPDYEDAD